ncbi:hypothetical protein [Intrasporangium sp.]|uniref:hypothetical protein n=1 Tax=Intrasporangium sp. TaxID=1925024 RepID=UPI003221AFEC
MSKRRFVQVIAMAVLALGSVVGASGAATGAHSDLATHGAARSETFVLAMGSGSNNWGWE